ncbi:MAG: LysM peptidoglycan-binding domain-containing protein [Candidatus Shapirobacteria bacterium]|nr:LysM peptidoglycan-binding domain-containing protein [Candidatus Shapirobacteria bacterium]MDD5073670.1 LysM peptidoglycan-binding domain-containing protein [Candidatus Shapirobacteria bacterium]MDD5481432.1 LysM peptidoglycan-binding domain-containing protein [Candidatus Shapirobacteria bacterium]
MSKERGKGNWRLALSAMVLVGELGLGDYQGGSEQPVFSPTSLDKKSSFNINSELLAENTVCLTSQENNLIKINQTVERPGTEADTAWSCPTEEVQGPITYIVKEGDSLTKISREHNNLPVGIIYNMNSQVIGDNPDLIRPGQELLLVRWGQVEASRYLVSKKTQEAAEKGEAPGWIYFTLTSELSAGEAADFFGISVEKITSLNEIDDPDIKLPKDYYLMVPVDGGFAFTETDRLAGRRWQPRPGVAFEAIWWEDPAGQVAANPEYPNRAFMMEPFPSESWVNETWSTADQLPSENFIPETVTDIPANRIWEIVDEEGEVTQEERAGFLVYGRHKITHTGYRKVEVGEWIFTE